MMRKPSASQRFTHMNASVSDALDKTLSPLGDGAKSAVLFTLQHKYSLPISGPILSFERVSEAILDLFGQDGGRLLLEKLWVNLEELAESNILIPIPYGTQSIQESNGIKNSKGEFNNQVSAIFANLISEMMGQDVYTWLEGKARANGTTLNNLYFDADRIVPVIFSSFSSAASFLLDNLVVKVSTTMGVKETHYANASSLKAILDSIRTQISCDA